MTPREQDNYIGTRLWEQDPHDTIDSRTGYALDLPYFTTSSDAAYRMEEKIFDLMLWEDYTKYLIKARIGTTEREANALYHMGLNNVELFLLAHASPSTRAQACVEMLQARELAK